MLEMMAASLWMFFMTVIGSRKTGPEFPADPAARSKHYVSHCLSFLKTELTQASIVTLEGDRVAYTVPRSSDRRSLWLEDGNVMQQVRDLPPVRVSQLGEEAMLRFERSSPGQLQVQIAGGANPAVRHEVSLRLTTA